MAILFLAGLGLCVKAQAKTWYIKADGTGDAPTIQAGCDSATARDSVLVGPGDYYVYPRAALKADVTLTSERGPLETVVHRGQPYQLSYFVMEDNSAIIGLWMRPETTLLCVNVIGSGVLISRNIIGVFGGSGAIGIQLVQTGEVSHNLIMGDGMGIYVLAPSLNVYIHHNIILNGIHCQYPMGMAYTECNDILGDQECVIPIGNFSLDPQFCGEGNYYLQADSPCAPGNHPDEGRDCDVMVLIGPLPVGCGPVAVERRSWGQIKAIYRGDEE